MFLHHLLHGSYIFALEQLDYLPATTERQALLAVDTDLAERCA